MPSDSTFAPTGAHSVPLKTTGHKKDHFTVVLTAKADGTKMKLFVIFKGKGTYLFRALQHIQGLVTHFRANVWTNDSLTIDCLSTIIGALYFSKCLMVWDVYRCHTSEAVRAETTRLQLHTTVVPGGCTKFIQAADVILNCCIKGHLRRHYDAWLADSPSLSPEHQGRKF